VWLTAGKDNLIRQWKIQKFDSLPDEDLVIHQIAGHTDQVMDIIEIQVPPCIATASLDKTIRLYSMAER